MQQIYGTGPASNLGSIAGRWVLSSLHQPWSSLQKLPVIKISLDSMQEKSEQREGPLRLASQTLNILCYVPLSNSGEKMASSFVSVTSEEIIQINFLWCTGILSHCFSMILLKTTFHLCVGTSSEQLLNIAKRSLVA